ncbi:MAG: S-layer homology domain-containing protein [Clostridiales bacterium]|nr:S-layer homology domain-containing protein [Clostridiales bacterium]
MMKKILICLVICISLFTTLAFSVEVNEENIEIDIEVKKEIDQEYIDNAIIALKKMKIIIGDEHGNLMLTKKFTRAEFATVIVRLIGKENTEVTNKKINFTDVNKSFWGYNNIYICVNEGYLIGDGDGKFRPNDYIKYEEVLTILVRLVNKDNGLTIWPDDYISKAEELQITKNTDLKVKTELIREDAFVLIYNCLNIKL